MQPDCNCRSQLSAQKRSKLFLQRMGEKERRNEEKKKKSKHRRQMWEKRNGEAAKAEAVETVEIEAATAEVTKAWWMESGSLK